MPDVTVSSAVDTFLQCASQATMQTTGLGFPVQLTAGATIASAATVNLAAATGNVLTVSGTTTITAFGTVASGAVFWITFSGALTLTHNATSLILPGAANITTAAGDVLVLVSLGSGNWRCASFTRASGLAVVSGGALGTPSSGALTNCTGLPVAGGGTGLASATAYAVLCGGTTGTGAFQSIASVGTSGHVLTSNGAGALPTFQAASGGVQLGDSPTWTGAHIFSKSGADSVSAVKVTGVPFAGTGTTSFPLVYINDANATASTTLNTAGTYFGINGDGTQDLMNLMKDGVTVCRVTSDGIMTLTNPAVTSAYYLGSSSAGMRLFNNGSEMMILSAGRTYRLNTTNFFPSLSSVTLGLIGAQDSNNWGGLILKQAGIAQWTDGSSGSCAATLGISQLSAGVLAIGTGAAANTAGGVALSVVNVYAGGTTSGTVTTNSKITKATASIADNTATSVLTVTIPNASHSGSLRVRLCGKLGAGGAIGAGEATGTIEYLFAIARTAGLDTVVGTSTAYGTATASVAGGATITVTAAATGMSGAASATQTFTVQVTISRGSGSSTNHTCLVEAEILNANATGITIA